MLHDPNIWTLSHHCYCKRAVRVKLKNKLILQPASIDLSLKKVHRSSCGGKSRGFLLICCSCFFFFCISQKDRLMSLINLKFLGLLLIDWSVMLISCLLNSGIGAVCSLYMFLITRRSFFHLSSTVLVVKLFKPTGKIQLALAQSGVGFTKGAYSGHGDESVTKIVYVLLLFHKAFEKHIFKFNFLSLKDKIDR